MVKIFFDIMETIFYIEGEDSTCIKSYEHAHNKKLFLGYILCTAFSGFTPATSSRWSNSYSFLLLNLLIP